MSVVARRSYTFVFGRNERRCARLRPSAALIDASIRKTSESNDVWCGVDLAMERYRKSPPRRNGGTEELATTEDTGDTEENKNPFPLFLHSSVVKRVLCVLCVLCGGEPEGAL